MGRARYLVAALTVACGGYALWSRLGRSAPAGPVELHLAEAHTLGQDAGAGNLLAIQPYMVPSDYASEDRFRLKLEGYFAAAREARLIGDKTLVILPEYLGAWLVVAGEKSSVYGAATVDEATTTMALSNLPALIRWAVASPAPQRTRYALFRMKARSMAAIYDHVLSGLAREYGVTVVGGSIILPSPSVCDGRLVAGAGPLYNASVVYAPDGRALGPIVRKVYLTGDERPFLSAGALEDLAVYDTPAGRLGVLICADSWYPSPYERLRDRRVELIAVPAFLSVRGGWPGLWWGYQGAGPEGVEAADVGHLTEGEAWVKYALPGRLAASGAVAGMTVFLRGRLWDLSADGPTLAVAGEAAHELPRLEGATMVNLWRPE